MSKEDFKRTQFMKNHTLTEEDKIFDEQAAFLLHKQKLERIESFDGPFFGFLNNDFPSLVGYSGITYPSVNAAFQAARIEDENIRHKISLIDSPDELWKIVANIEDPPTWQKDRLRIMELLLRDKFIRNRDLRERLKLTKSRQLINSYEQNQPSNIFWGMVDGRGQNQLGRMLETIRRDIQEGTEIDKWVMFTFSPENEKFMLPIINMGYYFNFKFLIEKIKKLMTHLDVIKEEKTVENKQLRGKSYYILGNMQFNDILCAHMWDYKRLFNIHLKVLNPYISISRSHCVILCDQFQNVKLIDLQSKAGTYLNDEMIEPLRGYQLKDGDVFNLAMSTRKYKVTLDYSGVVEALRQKEKEINKELTLIEKINDPNISQEQLRQALGFSIEDTIFVSNLPTRNNPTELKDIFETFGGKVRQVRVPIDKSTGQQRPMALITFYNEKDAQSALLKADRFDYKGKKIKVQLADRVSTTQVMGIFYINPYYILEESKDFQKLDDRRFLQQKERQIKIKQSRSKSRSRSRQRNKDKNYDKQYKGKEKTDKRDKHDKSAANYFSEEKDEKVKKDKKERKKKDDKKSKKHDKDSIDKDRKNSKKRYKEHKKEKKDRKKSKDRKNSKDHKIKKDIKKSKSPKPVDQSQISRLERIRKKNEQQRLEKLKRKNEQFQGKKGEQIDLQDDEADALVISDDDEKKREPEVKEEMVQEVQENQQNNSSQVKNTNNITNGTTEKTQIQQVNNYPQTQNSDQNANQNKMVDEEINQDQPDNKKKAKSSNSSSSSSSDSD